MSDLLEFRKRSLELALDFDRNQLLVREDIGAARFEQATGRTMLRSTDGATDFIDPKLGPFDLPAEDLPVLRILTDRGTEYCGKADSHDYQLYLAINDIEHTKTKVRPPQNNGICERFHKTILQEFYQSTLRRKICTSLEEFLHGTQSKLGITDRLGTLSVSLVVT